jgi:hypothetical protein
VCGPFIADGAACLVGFNCVSQSCVDPTTAMEPNAGRTGACKTRLANGETCSSLSTTCDSGSYCKGDAAGNGTCAAKEPAGTPCNSMHQMNQMCESGYCGPSTCSPLPWAAQGFCW